MTNRVKFCFEVLEIDKPSYAQLTTVLSSFCGSAVVLDLSDRSDLVNGGVIRVDVTLKADVPHAMLT